MADNAVDAETQDPERFFDYAVEGLIWFGLLEFVFDRKSV